MRVLYFSQGLTPHDRRFLAALRGAGLDTWFLRFSPPPGQSAGRSLSGITERHIRFDGAGGHARDMVAAVPQLVEVLREARPDIVHAGPVPTCGLAAALAGAHPLLVMSWGSDLLLDARRDPVTAWAARFALQHADAVSVDARAVADVVRGYRQFAPEQMLLMPWGVELSKFSYRPRSRTARRKGWGWTEAFVVCTCRTMAPLYRVDLVVRAFARARVVEPRLRLILAGEGPLRPQIEGLVQDLGIQAYTRIVGAQPEDELKHLFGASDLYVSASQSDGSSISLLQAMACGLPAVVSDLPANREWVEHGENGWLFPPDDEGGLGDCLVRCAALDAATCRQMGLRNRKTVERKADWPRNVRRLVAFYRTVSAGHRARRPTKQREDSP